MVDLSHHLQGWDHNKAPWGIHPCNVSQDSGCICCALGYRGARRGRPSPFLGPEADCRPWAKAEGGDRVSSLEENSQCSLLHVEITC